MDFPILLLYVSLVACMSVDRVLTHTDICACLIRVRGMTLAYPPAWFHLPPLKGCFPPLDIFIAN